MDREQRIEDCSSYSPNKRACWHLQRINELTNKWRNLKRQWRSLSRVNQDAWRIIRNQRRTLMNMNLEAVTKNTEIKLLRATVIDLQAIVQGDLNRIIERETHDCTSS